MGAAFETLAQVMRQAADVGSAGTDHAEADSGRRETRDLENAHLDRNGNRFQGQTTPRQFVGGNAANFLGGDQWRFLVVRARQPAHCFFDINPLVDKRLFGTC